MVSLRYLDNSSEQAKLVEPPEHLYFKLNVENFIGCFISHYDYDIITKTSNIFYKKM